MPNKSKIIKNARVTDESVSLTRDLTRMKNSSNFKNHTGLVNGNGLTNGKGLIDLLKHRQSPVGLVNGNGLSNGRGLGLSTSVKVQNGGLINGNGLTNGNGLSDDWSGLYKRKKFYQIAKIKAKNNRKRVFISIIAIFMLLLPLGLFITEIPSGERIKIDGKFNDWVDIEGIPDINELITENENIDIKSYKTILENKDLFLYFQVYGRILNGINSIK